MSGYLGWMTLERKRAAGSGRSSSLNNAAVALYEMIFIFCRTFSMYFLKKCF